MGAGASFPIGGQQFPSLEKITEGGENIRISYSASAMQGHRGAMTDARAVVPDLDDHTSFFGVYDGHGGESVALFCAKQFHVELCNHQDYQNNLPAAIRSVFFRMDELLLQSDEWKESLRAGSKCLMQFLESGFCAPKKVTTPYIAPQKTGSTACVAIIRNHQIIVGNAGDSRCVVSRNGQAVVLSVDHKPMDQAERNRIQRAGGEVVRDKIHTAEGFRGRRVGIPRINGILTVSRAIGDFEFKNNKQMSPEQQVVTCEPSVRGLTINHDVEFLVVASDGIWKSMSSQGVVDLVHHYTRSGVDDRSICEQLCQRSLKSMDNSTVILVRFKPVCQLAAPVDMNAPLGALQEEEEEQEDEESAGEIRPA
ncbi:hypothetical protein HU200_039140 [Digitaria exilis]|uniref:protein-serine/threonine phosphatase n=1 Tax=Digitaria exilis TaxID=1010633 RepID=A0A835EJ13_9POAL|nr:hypothetical protein HU200_039140 [Digitaria exilis]